MKNTFFLFILAIFLMTGCKENPVQEYGSTLTNAVKQSQNVSIMSEISNIKKAIREFSEEKGRLPQNIEEIENFMGRPIDKQNISYDPETGEVTKK